MGQRRRLVLLLSALAAGACSAGSTPGWGVVAPGDVGLAAWPPADLPGPCLDVAHDPLSGRVLVAGGPAGHSHRLLGDLGLPLEQVTEARLCCYGEPHERALHVASDRPAVLAAAHDGGQTFVVEDWTERVRPLEGHSAELPAAATLVGDTPGAGLLASPFSDDEGRTWDVGTVWACDDAGAAAGEATLHQVWVR